MLFSSARIGKALNVDGVPPLNDESQDDTKFGSSGDDLQAFNTIIVVQRENRESRVV